MPLKDLFEGFSQSEWGVVQKLLIQMFYTWKTLLCENLNSKFTLFLTCKIIYYIIHVSIPEKNIINDIENK